MEVDLDSLIGKQLTIKCEISKRQAYTIKKIYGETNEGIKIKLKEESSNYNPNWIDELDIVIEPNEENINDILKLIEKNFINLDKLNQ